MTETIYRTYREMMTGLGRKYSDTVMFEYVEGREDRQKTYGEFLDEAMALGAALWEEDHEGAHTAILGRNSYSWILSFAATLFGRSVAVTLNPAASAEVVQAQIRHSEARLLIYDDEQAAFAEKIPGLRCLSMSALPALIEKGRGLLARGRSGFAGYAPSPEQLAFIMYTSGTGGGLKGVMAPHLTCVSQPQVISRFYPLQGKSLLAAPFCHIGDLMVGLQAYPLLGNTLVINRNPKNIFADMQRSRPEVADMVPMLMEGICKRTAGMSLDEARDFLGGKLRVILGGGAALAPHYRQWLARLGISLVFAYGMTEFCVFAAAETTENVRPGSVGQVFPGVSLAIDQPDEGGNGEIIIKKDHMMSGYYKNPEETAQALRNGWLHTGDIGRLDEDGYLYITGRLKNLIILSNGENVSPEELETPLLRSPFVAECIVYESAGAIAVDIYPDFSYAAAQGLAGPGLFDRIRAEVDALNKTFSLSRHIREIRLTETPLPRTHTGKIKRMPHR